MIDLRDLDRVIRYLDARTSARRNLADELKQYFEAIFQSGSYQNWLANDQFRAASAASGQPDLPFEPGNKYPHAERIVRQFLLSVNGKLQVKIDSHRGRIHVTDGFWVDPHVRVFPTADESEVLCKYISDENQLDQHVDILIDPACGCGHHGLGLNKIPRRISLDVSLRAIAFARLNAILSGDETHLIGLNDINDGFPRELALLRGKMLFAVNMPFAIYPRIDQGSGSLAQDGGERGIQLTLAAARAIKELSTRTGCTARAVILAYSLGTTLDSGKYRWDVLEQARTIFPSATINFRLRSEERLWRVNGKKEQPNPMPLNSLKLKADCHNSFQDRDRDAARRGYEEITNTFHREGFDCLGYGILDIEI